MKEEDLEEDSLSEFWKDWKAHSQDKREKNRINSADLLESRGIDFEIKNGGAHLIVKGKILIDFWPGTGKFITRDGKKGRGVFNLLKLLEAP